MSLGPTEIGLVLLAVMLLFGYEKLPDASRSLGRSLRIFTGEMDDLRDEPATADLAPAPPATGEAAALPAPAALVPETGHDHRLGATSS